ncbi:hypothetical protein FRB96_004503 [Tulasnella sp. 330]|nr:hypothetical protein FRB96_004503 [Tulasnella sp. 330]
MVYPSESEKKLITSVEELMEETMKKYDPSHDALHAKTLSPLPDPLIVELAALMHDLADKKYVKLAPGMTTYDHFLPFFQALPRDESLDIISDGRLEMIVRIVENVSWTTEKRLRAGEDGGITRWYRECKELHCVQDADRLDAIGAFGIMRCAAYSAAVNQPLFVPSDQTESRGDPKESAVGHFHDKLLLIRERLKTDAGRAMGEKRHQAMLDFLKAVDEEYELSTSSPATTLDEGPGKENRPQHPLATMITGHEPSKGPASLFAGKVVESTQRPAIKGLAGRDPGRLVEAGAMNRAFEKMLDDMQIPSTLRPKLVTLDTPVKAAMLKSSHTLNVLATAAPASPLAAPKFPSLRKAQSSESLLSSPTRPFGHSHSSSLDGGDLDLPLMAPRPLSGNFGTTSSYNSGNSSLGGSLSPNASVEFLPHTVLYPEVVNGVPVEAAAAAAKTKSKNKASKEKAAREKERERELEQAPEAMALWLAQSKSTALDVDRLKKLRVLLRNETASWSETFLRQGGYSALLGRLNELLEVEWREEQHDDQALHELLRCFKALSTSSIGCFALRSSCPTPFTQLTALLYSDKKPGDLASRQLIVDLLLILFELYPPAVKVIDDAGSIGRQRTAWDVKGSGHVIPPARPTVFTTPSSSPPPPLPAPHDSIFSLLRATLLTPRPAPSECPSTPVDPHAFIAALHRPRIYKTYLQELSDVRRDYFWVFCHQNNTIWDLKQTDEEKVEKPKAPGGMTGGVEFEAMTYLTTHFRLLNTLCRAAMDLQLPATDETSAYQLHVNLFESGLEKIILTSRKASTIYYPNLHLEIARYVVHATQARFELPWSVSRLVGPPPEPLVRRRGAPSGSTSPRMDGSRPGSPVPLPRPVARLGHLSPVLPPPRRMEELRF